jgi:hypothetical protein
MNTSINTAAALTLVFADLRTFGTWDRANRWNPDSSISAYFRTIRSPSRAWPYSRAKAACTHRFLDWLERERPSIYATDVPESVRAARIEKERNRLERAARCSARGCAPVAEAMGL